MSAPRVAKAIADLREAAAQAAWLQWSAIFSIASSRRAAHAIVDPEALLLASIALRDHEPRLWSAAVSWSQVGARLLSVQRAKNLVAHFPEPTRQGLGEFAQLAVKGGGDLRWQSVLGREARPHVIRERPKPAAIRTAGEPALVLRLRLGLGVGIKPDVLACLIGHAGASLTVQLAASATSYYPRAVRRVLEELAAADFIETRSTAPVSYRVDLRKWSLLLSFDSNEPPIWRPWAPIYAFVSALDQWSKNLPRESEFVLASEARDLVSVHASSVEPAIRLPPTDKVPGAAYLEPFLDTLKDSVEFVQGVT